MHEENPIVKMSVCGKCKRIVRIAVWIKNSQRAKNAFLKEVAEYDLSVESTDLKTYREKHSDNFGCKCQ